MGVRRLVAALVYAAACGDNDLVDAVAENPGLDCQIPGACATLEPEALGPPAVGALSVESYAGCGCDPGGLFFANDQAAAFVRRASSAGWERRFQLEDRDAIATGLVEDGAPFGGKDHLYADNVDLMFVAAHGGSFPTYHTMLCRETPGAACSAASDEMVLGERPASRFAERPGRLRFLVLATCDSVSRTDAPVTWGPLFARGRRLSAVLGYDEESTDSWTTSEAGEDFAAKALDDGWTLLQAWLWAAGDWLIEDAPAMIVAGADRDDAMWRLSSLEAGWPPSPEPPRYVAWLVVER